VVFFSTAGGESFSDDFLAVFFDINFRALKLPTVRAKGASAIFPDTLV